MANAEQIRKVCSIITSDPKRRVVVVSAPGKRFDSDIKVTDLLIDCAEKYLNNGDYETVLNKIVDRYLSTQDGIRCNIIKDMRTTFGQEFHYHTTAPKFMDHESCRRR